MDIDAIVKIGALAVALFAIPKIWREIEGLQLTHRRNAFDLARELTQAVTDSRHPLLIEIGYRSLFRKSKLSAPEIVYLLSLPRPSRALQLYSRGYDYLNFVDGVADGNPSVGFDERCLTHQGRMFFKAAYVIAYQVFFIAAVSLILYFKGIFGEINIVSLTLATVSGVVFIVIAFVCLAEFMSVLAAEKFIGLQGEAAV